MSSNHLNYELSKQLKELGVEFERSVNESLYCHEEGNISGCARGYNLRRIFKGTVIEDFIHCPTTAQLIDEIQKHVENFMIDSIDNYYYIIEVTEEIKHKQLASNSCCTTALGLALIELVKNEKENG
jgi:hypothetical protein